MSSFRELLAKAKSEIREVDTATADDLRRLPTTGSWQLFCLDPSGARVELDFDASEAAP